MLPALLVFTEKSASSALAFAKAYISIVEVEYKNSSVVEVAVPTLISEGRVLLNLRAPVLLTKTSLFVKRPERPVTGPATIISTLFPFVAEVAANPIKLVFVLEMAETVPFELRMIASPLEILPLATRVNLIAFLGPLVKSPNALSNSVEIRFRGIVLSSSPKAEPSGSTIPPAAPCERPALPIKIVLFAK